MSEQKKKTIVKKLLTEYFSAVQDGVKTFELRKDEDDIQPGDKLELREWTGSGYTGRTVICDVTYVLRGCPQFGLMDGYCIIGINVLTEGYCNIGTILNKKADPETESPEADGEPHLQEHLPMEGCMSLKYISQYMDVTDNIVDEILSHCKKQKINMNICAWYKDFDDFCDDWKMPGLQASIFYRNSPKEFQTLSNGNIIRYVI